MEKPGTTNTGDTEMTEKPWVLLNEHEEKIEEAMEHQDHEDEEFLLEKVIELGFKVVNSLEGDVSTAELSVLKHYGSEEEYKRFLAKELAYFTQGKQEEYMQDHTLQELETAVEVTTSNTSW